MPRLGERQRGIFLTQAFMPSRPSVDWWSPTDTGRPSALLCPQIQMLASSRSTLTHPPEIMSIQIPGHLVAQPSWRTKLTIPYHIIFLIRFSVSFRTMFSRSILMVGRISDGIHGLHLWAWWCYVIGQSHTEDAMIVTNQLTLITYQPNIITWTL